VPTTPQQGLPFQAITDQPCGYAVAIGALALAEDAKAAGYTTDLKRAQANSFVKISVGSIPVNTDNTFTTVEVNRNTQTDLSVFNGLILGPGMWMAGANVIWGAGGAGIANNAFLSTLSPVACFAYVRDANGTLPNIGIGWPNQGACVTSTFLVTAASAHVALSWGIFSPTVSATLWAFQIGDF